MPQDPQYHFDPFGGAYGQPNFDPDGPDGQLVDITDEFGRTIGELSKNPEYQDALWQKGGWVRGEDGTAIPASLMTPPGPPDAVKAMLAQQGSVPTSYTSPQQGRHTAILLLLLLS